ncbi:integral membrane protein [mine drainage metagenome]|uniref:EamA family transporter n=2 Tax=root TaxID=1 RepID=A0A8F3DXX2_9PROT|nr:EamA family transporter [Ferrovum myxofaciens]KXW59122.1 EamA-like transporter family protein [Ferrovum myxofaciens]QKE38871.1 MAG: EamA family transporter [Ferrovum myxofaciens]QWY74079.1 MAG: EamA family transporter [Ferrovum myxofaciens]QWY76831.1 MAG: EamA family transporter [Ferrovum myxofaciens]
MKAIPAWALFALGSAFFAGLTALFGKLGVAGIPSNFATFIRTLIILALTAGILSLRHEWQRFSTLSLHTWTFLILSGIATGLSWLCYYRALQLGPLSGVAPLDKLSVVFALLLGVLLLGERLNWHGMLGIALIVSGSLVLLVA